MNRFFRVESTLLEMIRLQVMDALGQPNGKAEEPWPVGGNFSDGEHGYIALGPHHTEGDFFGPLFAQMVALPGVEEITEEEYFAAMLHVEEVEEPV